MALHCMKASLPSAFQGRSSRSRSQTLAFQRLAGISSCPTWLALKTSICATRQSTSRSRTRSLDNDHRTFLFQERRSRGGGFNIINDRGPDHLFMKAWAWKEVLLSRRFLNELLGFMVDPIGISITEAIRYPKR